MGEMSLDGGCDEGKYIATLLTTTLNHRQHRLHKSTATKGVLGEFWGQRGSFGVRAPVVISSTISNNDVMSYDGIYQLATLQRGQLNANKDGLVAESKTFAEQWTLDPTGNWTNFKQDTDGNGSWNRDQNRTHNEANEVATIAGASTHVAHDVAGNMIRAPKPSDWSDHYHLVYDAWNRLVTVFDADGETLVAGYNYDALGRRVEKETYSGGSLTEIRHYYYSNQWQVLEEHVQSNYYSGSSSSSLQPPAPSLQYVWGLRYIDDLILRDRDADSDSETGNYGKTGSGLEERLYALQDPNWNVVAIADASGDVQERYCYDAYGRPSFLTSAFVVRNPNVSSYSWDVLYTGRQYDPETGFYHCRMRPLGSGLGRFLGRDPIWDDDNPYRYVRNNPVVYVDPTGEKVYWCARDVDNPAGTGDHHYIVVVPDNPDDFPGQLNDLFGGKQGFTLAGFEKNGCLVYEKNNQADIAATREFNAPDRYSKCPNKYKSGWSQDCHEVDPPNGMSDTQFINKLLEDANNYAQNTKGKCVEFDVWWGPNCASWTNSLFASAGVSEADRNRLGEFGFLWGFLGGQILERKLLSPAIGSILLR